MNTPATPECSVCGKPAVASESPIGNPDEPAYCAECAKRVADCQTLTPEEVEHQKLLGQIEALKNHLTTGRNLEAYLDSLELTSQLREHWITSK